VRAFQMGGLFGGGGKQQPVQQVQQPAPEPIQQDDPQAAAKALKERKRLRLASGAASNILTSGKGITEKANTASGVLLG